jgi:hypothetical protein
MGATREKGMIGEGIPPNRMGFQGDEFSRGMGKNTLVGKSLTCVLLKEPVQ